MLCNPPGIAGAKCHKLASGPFHTGLILRRAVAVRVNCFIRSNSSSNCLRPIGVSLYACFSRDLSSCLKRAIHRSLSSRRRAPYNVPVLNRTRPLLRVSISFIRAYPWRGSSTRLIRIKRTGSVSGLVSMASGCIMTCRMATYYCRDFRTVKPRCDKFAWSDLGS
jgi:hypothetical protein